MSQRQPGKNRSGARKSRKNRGQKRPAQASQKQQAQQQQAPDEQPQAESVSKESKPSARRSAGRRNERRAEAQKKAKQKKQLQMIGGAVAVAVVVAIVLVLVNRPSNEGIDSDYSGLAFAPPPVTAAPATPDATSEPNPEEPMTGAVLGDPNAPVTMVVYADFECPYCRIFASDTQQQVIDDFVRDGQVKLEFREFPVLGGQDLTDDNNTSAQTAEAVMCAAEQGAYLDYHDKLYANQGAFSDGRLKQYAEELDLDTDAFGECLDSGRYEPAIQQMKAEGQALGITATPMFLINGAPTQMTDQGYDLLKRQLEAAVETAE